jgi:hypothetical protein
VCDWDKFQELFYLDIERSIGLLRKGVNDWNVFNPLKIDYSKYKWGAVLQRIVLFEKSPEVVLFEMVKL